MCPKNSNNESEKIERVACYIRVSSVEQKLHGLSIDAQEDKLRTYSKNNGLKIVEFYKDEGISGTKPIRQRPALQQMLNDAREGKFDRIIFIKLDRYFRSVGEYYECQKILDSCGVLWTATEEKFDLTTANGRYWVTQKLAMAEYEAGTTSERICLVNDYKVKTGQPLTGSHCQGLAYMVIKGEDGLKRVVPDPDTREHVLEYIDHFMTYRNKRKAMTHVNEMFGTSYSYNVLSKLLHDTKLCGEYRDNPYYCEPLISKEKFEKLQELSKAKTRPAVKNIYLFSGLIKCPCCGRNMAATTTVKKNRKEGINKEYIYYKCPKKIRDNNCEMSKTPNEEKTEKYLLENVERIIDKKIKDIKIEDAKIKNDNYEKSLSDLEKEMSRLNNLFVKGRLKETEYENKYIELESRCEALRAKIKPRNVRDVKEYENILKSGWRSLYESLSKKNKKAFWSEFVKQIVIDENGDIIDLVFF